MAPKTWRERLVLLIVALVAIAILVLIERNFDAIYADFMMRLEK